jgi:Cu(I)/Ag(I) efflux system periplasmic protein CusF
MGILGLLHPPMSSFMTQRLHSLFLLAFATAIGMPATAATPANGASSKVAAATAASATPLAEGLVKKIDKVGQRVTLSHGPLPGGMPAMTMAYRVKNAAWLDQMKEGQKIRFATDPADGGMSMLRFEPVK